MIFAIPEADRRILEATLLTWYRSDPDPGVHGAIGWLLRQREQGDKLATIDREFSGPSLPKDRDWYVNGQGQTFSIIRGPSEFTMGSPEGAIYRQPDEVLHRVRIDRSYAIATREVTVAEYVRFLNANPTLNLFRPDRHEQVKAFFLTPDCPIAAVDWYDCARYCNWLSKKEGIPESEWCYPADLKPGVTLTMPANILSRTGYRLPTEAEWESACRAGPVTPWPFGGAEDWLPRYAWFSLNAGLRAHPVGQLRPNDLGLFDMLGNTFEWLQEPYAVYRVGPPNEPILDVEANASVLGEGVRLLRGGVFYFPVSGVRSSGRDWIFPTGRDMLFGFRPARTCP